MNYPTQEIDRVRVVNGFPEFSILTSSLKRSALHGLPKEVTRSCRMLLPSFHGR